MNASMASVALALAWCTAGSTGQRGAVTLYVTDYYGGRISKGIVKIDSPAGLILSRDGEVKSLAFGTYRLTAVVPGFDPFQADVVIDQPEQVVLIAMRLGQIEGPPVSCGAEGKLPSGLKGGRVRFAPVFSSEVRDVPIRPGGVFEAVALECGLYTVTAVSGKEIAGSLTIRLTSDRTRILIPTRDK